MDAMINGCLLAQVYINEIREETPEGELWEPKESWLQRYGTEALKRLGIRQLAFHAAEPVEQCDTDARIAAPVEG